MKKTKLVTYKYVFQTAEMLDEKKLGVKYLTDAEEGHDKFMEQIKDDESVIKCLREYVGEYDCSMLGFVQTFKGGEENEAL